MSGDRPEPRWVHISVVRAIHADQIRQHGGLHGIRDVGLLESALVRAPNRWHYEHETDLPTLAAAYGKGIAGNHPFIDGNKRTAFQGMYLFLGLNGFRIVTSEPEVVKVMTDLASGEIDEVTLTEWLRTRIEPR